jgi:protein AroM
MSRTLPVFVIGQTPRPDVEAEMLLAAPDVGIRVEGALDGMSRDQIARQALAFQVPTPCLRRYRLARR